MSGFFFFHLGPKNLSSDRIYRINRIFHINFQIPDEFENAFIRLRGGEAAHFE